MLKGIKTLIQNLTSYSVVKTAVFWERLKEKDNKPINIEKLSQLQRNIVEDFEGKVLKIMQKACFLVMLID